jgi:hypothetical protein
VAARANQNKILMDAAAREAFEATVALQDEIWDQAVTGSSGFGYTSSSLLLLPALNEMIDIVTKRSVAIQTYPPMFVWVALSVLALICAGLVG